VDFGTTSDAIKNDVEIWEIVKKKIISPNENINFG